MALLTLAALAGCAPNQPAGAAADASSDDEMATSEEATPGEDTGYDTDYDTDAARLQVAQDGPRLVA